MERERLEDSVRKRLAVNFNRHIRAFTSQAKGMIGTGKVEVKIREEVTLKNEYGGFFF